VLFASGALRAFLLHMQASDAPCTRRAERAPFTLRERLRAAFPSAPAKQSVLLHASLARVLAPPADAAALAAARAACELATAQLRGREVRCASIWHVIELALPVDGTVTALPLAAAE
jgi:hypothetical protein